VLAVGKEDRDNKVGQVKTDVPRVPVKHIMWSMRLVLVSMPHGGSMVERML
jgi:hypothetical protein